MSDNLKEVLMAVIALISAIVTPLIVVIVNNKQIKKLVTVETKVDQYHKAVNGNMEKLLETTKQLATAQERARGEADDKPKK